MVHAQESTTTHPDLVIVALVLHVLVKLFLWVELYPAHLQFLPYLWDKQESQEEHRKLRVT